MQIASNARRKAQPGRLIGLGGVVVGAGWNYAVTSIHTWNNRKGAK